MPASVDVLSLPEVEAAASADTPNLLYWTIYQGLVRSIEADTAAVGKDLPIERLISAHYSASRFTVRQALDLLEKRGYIAHAHRQPGQAVPPHAACHAHRVHAYRVAGHLD